MSVSNLLEVRSMKLKRNMLKREKKRAVEIVQLENSQCDYFNCTRGSMGFSD